jgi:small subunit ribosomal protein S9
MAKAEHELTSVGGTKKYKDYMFAIGRRRSAVARVRVYTKTPDGLKFGEYLVKKGDMAVNEKNITEYFSGNASKVIYEKPLVITDSLNKYAITAKVQGGGLQSQLGAFVLGLSRALAAIDETSRPILRKKNLLTRDPRVRQRRKVGMGGKSRARKQSPKR